MMMSGLVLIGLLVADVQGAGQGPQPALQIDLRSHGWHVDRRLLNGSTLRHNIDFADDDSLWVAFPSEADDALHYRDASSGYSGKILHIAASGEVAEVCDPGAQRWGYLRLFGRSADGFTLDTVGRLVAYDARCRVRATYPTDVWTQICPSPDRALIYVRTRANEVHVLNSGNLQVIKALKLPENVRRNHVLFGDRTVIYPATVPTKGCWRSQFSRLEIATGRVTPWMTIECARFNLLGDGQVIYTDLRGDNPLEITGESGGPTGTYKPPRHAYLDLSVLETIPVESPRSLRVVEELIEAKWRHPALDMSGRFVGRKIVLLDMRSGTALLTVNVPMSTGTYSYALSRDGKNLAVLLNSYLSVYRVP
ncbi:MAG: hypothetical protein WA900_13475 [Casimicrobiaceae bacterium]